MVEMEKRELLGSLRGYLEELRDSGVEELPFAQAPAPASPAAAEAASSPPRIEDAGVTGSGNPRARLLLVITGEGFAGPAGELLANIVKAMGFATDDIHLLSIANGASASDSFQSLLTGRIGRVAPEVVVAMGEEAARLLLYSSEPIAKLRGRFIDLQGIPVMATLHPDQMLADPSLKRGVWNEMQQVMARLK